MADSEISPQLPSPVASLRTRKPKYSKLTQQELPALRLLLTPKWVLIILSGVGVVFVPIGIVCLSASRSVVETSARYDDICLGTLPAATTDADRDALLQLFGGDGLNCTVTLRAPQLMKAPIFIHYELDNFFQNHRRYVKSRSDTQLRGDVPKLLSDCAPEQHPVGDDGKAIDPCGLVAWSFFNDTFSVSSQPDGALPAVPLAVNEQGIAWKSDKSKKFGAFLTQNFNDDPATRGGGAITGPVKDDEHFIVWMRTAALPNFRKLWGRIETDIPAGTELRIRILNRYSSYRFGGKKKIILSTTSWLGGRNDFLSIAYLVVGCASFAAALVFTAALQRWPRKLGDPRLLSWNKVKLV